MLINIFLKCHFLETITNQLKPTLPKILSTDCPKEKLSKMRQLILATFQKEQRRKVTSKILIDELYFRYNRDRDLGISSSEMKKLVTDYIMYANIKELTEICHPIQWLKTEDKDKNGFLSKDEFSESFGKINLSSLYKLRKALQRRLTLC